MSNGIRSADEIAMYAYLRGREIVLTFDFLKAHTALGIHEKRAFRMIEKWERLGYYEMSSIPPCGAFTQAAPFTLTERGE